MNNAYFSFKIIFLIIIGIIIICYINENNNNLEIENFADYRYKYFDKCYVINLNETDEGKLRWQRINKINEFAGILTKFDGVYGKNRNKQLYDNKIVNTKWDSSIWKYNNKNGIFNLSDSEIGCCLSHYLLWKKLANSKNLNKIMIFEDDANKPINNYFKYLDIIHNEVPKDWDIILIGYVLLDSEKISKNIVKVKNFILLHNYIINKKGAKKLLNNLPINAPLDTWLSLISNKLNIYTHNFNTKRNKYSNSKRSILISTKGKSQIKHTNLVPANK